MILLDENVVYALLRGSGYVTSGQACELSDCVTEAGQSVDGMVLLPRVLNEPMRAVLTKMLTQCRSVDESYAELIESAAKEECNG